MRNNLLLFAFALLFSRCVPLEFEQPLPNEGQAVKALPRNLVGTYRNTADSNSIIKEYQRIEFIPKDATWQLYSQVFIMAADLDTSKEAFIRNDSLFSFESDSSAPKFALMVKRFNDRYIAPEKLRYHIEPLKGKFLMSDKDTDEPIPHTLVLRKLEDVYYFNLQADGAKYWRTTTLQQTPLGIRLQYLSFPEGDKSALPFATRQELVSGGNGNPDTIRVARPTDRELAKYRTDVELVNFEDLIRVVEQK